MLSNYDILFVVLGSLSLGISVGFGYAVGRWQRLESEVLLELQLAQRPCGRSTRLGRLDVCSLKFHSILVNGARLEA